MIHPLEHLGVYGGGADEQFENHGGTGGSLLTVTFHQPSHEFTFSVVMSFIPYPLVLPPLA
jgi:hypothetical protein